MSFMKKALYWAALIILLLIAGSVLLLYYTQPFSEDFNFKNEINYSDIQIQSNQGYNGEIVLSYARAEVGTLELKNEGYFTQGYSLPQLIGCIDSPNNTDSPIQQNQFNIEYQNGRNSVGYNIPIEIPVGEEKTITLEAVYNNYNVPLSQFSRENIKSVSIYKISEKENNPIKINYDYRDYGYHGCSALKSNGKPMAVIQITA